MSDIDYKRKGSILNPLKALQFFARPPVTVPLEPRPAEANYRGFHLNDHERCVGCSSCQKVCDNAAITMVRIPDLPDDPARGIRNLRPAIDYGRCCWCALCVDICPTQAITLSREYVHTCTQENIDSYFMLPDANGIHGTPFEKGWQTTPDSELLDLARQPMAMLAPAARVDDFSEVVGGFTDQQAVIEASRCVQCGMCFDACPTHMNAPEYIRAIWQGDPEAAVEWIYRTNPFAHVCGRVCTRRCEDACSIGRRGEPVAIRWLKRYAMDAVGHDKVIEIAARDRVGHMTGHRVAVIGAGPAGLTAAFDLVKQGHTVTVYEATDKAGGMVRYGIPEYRLPYPAMDLDIDVITSLGVDIRYNTRIGVDIDIDRLRDDYDAVLVAIGLHVGRSTRIPGSDHPDVQMAIDVLHAVTDGAPYEVPRRAVIIGAGNVAMDIARTLVRLQKQHYGQADVTLTARKELQYFKADLDEIEEAREEGVDIRDARAPRECVIEDGRLVGLRTVRVVSSFDADGRLNPVYDEDDETVFPADRIYEATGQAAELSLLGDELTEQLAWHRGWLQVDDAGRTSEPWLWAAGDMVHGPDVVHAVADGHRAAASIHAWLGAGTKESHT